MGSLEGAQAILAGDKRINVCSPASSLYLNLWNDNPYCILDGPWSSADQKRAAGLFLDFLMSDPVQRAALDHGFRPGNLNIPVKTPDSPFVRYASSGLKIEVGSVGEPPKAEVINNLLGLWQRTSGNR
jgi:ABC-type sulfate transport system substrate-binding protein